VSKNEKSYTPPDFPVTWDKEDFITECLRLHHDCYVVEQHLEAERQRLRDWQDEQRKVKTLSIWIVDRLISVLESQGSDTLVLLVVRQCIADNDGMLRRLRGDLML
jgi:hypothetical protein